MATAQSITSKPNGFPNNTPRADTTAGAVLHPTREALYSPDPLAPDFGIRLVVDAMSPAYELGDTVLARHRRKGERIKAGADYLFATPKNNATGMRIVRLARLTGRTATHWVCLQHKDRKVCRLSRTEFPTVFVVVGKYCTSNPALAGRA